MRRVLLAAAAIGGAASAGGTAHTIAIGNSIVATASDALSGIGIEDANHQLCAAAPLSVSFSHARAPAAATIALSG